MKLNAVPTASSFSATKLPTSSTSPWAVRQPQAPSTGSVFQNGTSMHDLSAFRAAYASAKNGSTAK